jgi:hypothetical protein
MWSPSYGRYRNYRTYLMMGHFSMALENNENYFSTRAGLAQLFQNFELHRAISVEFTNVAIMEKETQGPQRSVSPE